MEKLHCHIYANSETDHLRQIYTGFALLHRRGIINLRQTVEEKTLGRFEESHLRVVLDNRLTIYYDMHDCGEILPQHRENVDFYFKRSFAADIVSQYPEKDKIFPFGFNYPVFRDAFDRFSIARSKLYKGKMRLKNIVRGIGLTTVSGRHPQDVGNFEDLPNFDAEPNVIFMAKIWNPDKIENKTKREETEQINLERARCIALLRKEFGAKFFGGLVVDDYSQKYFKEFLLPSESISSQKNYLEVLKKYPISVTTKGLCNSNGWKLAEYIALSKAIVSEKLYYQPSGDFAENRNYLRFDTPDECVEKVVKLFEDKSLRDELMQNNFDYYQNFLRPDKLILNTLLIAEGNQSRSEK